MKSLTIFRNLIGDTTLKGLQRGNLFGWLLRHAFVFTDNIREMPKTNIHRKNEDEQMNDSMDSEILHFCFMA